jgi:hypothetical protein
MIVDGLYVILSNWALGNPLLGIAKALLLPV